MSSHNDLPCYQHQHQHQHQHQPDGLRPAGFWHRLLNRLSRPAKQAILLLADALMMPVLLWAAFNLRLDGIGLNFLPNFPHWPLWISLMTPLLFWGLQIYQAVVRTFDEWLLERLIIGCSVVALLLLAIALFQLDFMPRSVPFIFASLLFLWVWGSRLLIRQVVRYIVRADRLRRVAIYGAGTAGRQLLAALQATDDYLPVVFVDDARELGQTTVMGMPVWSGRRFQQEYQRLRLDEILIAIPSLSRQALQDIIQSLESTGLHIRSLPAVTQLVDGQVGLADIAEVDIESLLGRDPVPPMPELMQRNIRDQVVMVTGAGGSIGSELCRQILSQQPARLLLWEQGEFQLYSIEMALRPLAGRTELVPILGSILDQARMLSILHSHQVQTIYHAAAYKHVPLVEANPFEGMETNTRGTYLTAQAAQQAGVQTFVLISTDKAVRPTNIMGASKRLAEQGLQALAASSSSTCFCMVRFGNVLGSSGSVVPLFRQQIARGGPVTVTHPDMVRYFMTITEAAQLVIQAGAMAEGGDVFVLDMGAPVQIRQLAERMIRLSGLTVQQDQLEGGRHGIAIEYSGLRPGEKLFEELLIGNNTSQTAHPRILRAMENRKSLAAFEHILTQLTQLADRQDQAGLRTLLYQEVEGYHTENGG